MVSTSRRNHQYHDPADISIRLFIINGAITIFFGVLSCFVLPNFPADTKWLTEEERAFAQWRLQLDADEEDDKQATTVWQGLILCLKDYRLYVFILTQHLSILTMTFQYFFPSIMNTLGYGSIETLLLTVSGHRSISQDWDV